MSEPSVPGDRSSTIPDHDPTRGLHSPAQWWRVLVRSGRRIVVVLVGFAIVGAGLALLVLPGPGMIVLIVGLAVLATEFAWAERMLDRAASSAHAVTSKVASSPASRRALIGSAASLVIGGGVVVALASDWRMIGFTAIGIGVVAAATQHRAVITWLEGRTSGASRATAAGPTGDAVVPQPTLDEEVTS